MAGKAARKACLRGLIVRCFMDVRREILCLPDRGESARPPSVVVKEVLLKGKARASRFRCVDERAVRTRAFAHQKHGRIGVRKRNRSAR